MSKLKFALGFAGLGLLLGTGYSLLMTPAPAEIPPILEAETETRRVVASVEDCELRVILTNTRSCGSSEFAVSYERRYEIDLATVVDLYLSVDAGYTYILFMPKRRLPWQLDRPAGVANTRFLERCDGTVSELSYDSLPAIGLPKALTPSQQRTLTAFAKACH